MEEQTSFLNKLAKLYCLVFSVIKHKFNFNLSSLQLLLLLFLFSFLLLSLWLMEHAISASC